MAKHRFWLHRVCAVVSVFLIFCASSASAEIYKWVDEHGNVQFGDKPKDPGAAEQAERVEVNEAYQPTERTPEEKIAYEKEQEAMKRRREVYDAEDREAREKKQAAEREVKEQRCAFLKEELETMTRMHMIDGVPTYYYYEDENGKSVSSARQKEMIAEMKQQYAVSGCQNS